jgi:hypothetical protein
MLRIEIGATYVVDYTNFRKERGTRRIRVVDVVFGKNEYHPVPELLVVAVDVERGVERTFAASGIHDLRAE